MITIPEKKAHYFLKMYMEFLSSAALFNKQISKKIENKKFQSNNEFLLEYRAKILKNPNYFEKYFDIANLSNRKKDLKIQ